MTTYDNRPKVRYYECTSGGAQYCYGCYTMTLEEYGDYVAADDLFAAIAIQGIAAFFSRLQPAVVWAPEWVAVAEKERAKFAMPCLGNETEFYSIPLYASPVTPAAQTVAVPDGILSEALERMDRARRILTGGNPTPDCNWGMLDTADLRALLSATTTPAAEVAVPDEIETLRKDVTTALDVLAKRTKECEEWKAAAGRFDANNIELRARIKELEAAQTAAVPDCHPGVVERLPCIYVTAPMLREALEYVAPDGTPDQDDHELVLVHGDGHDGQGLYAYLSDCPEEGSIKIDGNEYGALSPATPAKVAAGIDREFMDALDRGEHLKGLGDPEQVERAVAIARKFPLSDAQPAKVEDNKKRCSICWFPVGMHHLDCTDELRAMLSAAQAKEGK